MHIMFFSPHDTMDKSYRICMIHFTQGSMDCMACCPLVLWGLIGALCSVNESLITFFGLCQWDGLAQNLKCTHSLVSQSPFEAFP